MLPSCPSHPIFFAILVMAGLLPAPSSAAPNAAAPSLPHWIWNTSEAETTLERPSQPATVVFQRTLELTRPVRTATLKVAADFCQVSVFINDRCLLRVEADCQTIEIDATQALAMGTNSIELHARKDAGPSAVAASLSMGVADDSELRTIVSDEAWICSSNSSDAKAHLNMKNAVSLGAVTPELWGIGRRSSKVEATENYEQWRQAVAGTATDENRFWTVPGFEISLVRSATAEEGSWVSMAFDARGRLTIAGEEKGLLRMTLDRDSRSIARVEVIDDQLLECRGLLYAHNALYANANDSKGLYRLRDIDGDDHFDDIQLLRAFPGGVGHGRNDLALGKDGWIYSVHGDSVDVPSDRIVDRTSPFRDRLGGRSPGQGHVVRTDADGKQWEIVCSGLRNPFGLAVNPNGDCFTYDADAEFDMGSPWYRPTRVVQVRSGADYGWRAVTGKWPPYFPDHPDNAMPTLDIGKGSPTAVLFATEAKFPEAYRRSLLILDWTYGRILAVHLSPRGAGYRAQAETFLQGRPLNVTDLAVGPDGALYIITGGRKTQSALYRIAYLGPFASATAPSLHEQHCAGHAARAKQTLLQLEAMHSAEGRWDRDSAWLYLDSPDWNLRQAARVAIEHQPISAWRERALSESRTTAAIEACLALVRSGDQTATQAVLARLLGMKPAELELSQAWGLMQCYSLLEQSSVEVLQGRRSEVLEQVESLAADLTSNGISYGRCGTSSQLMGTCLSLLAKLGSSTVVASTSRTLLRSPVQEQRLHALLALRHVETGWTKETRQDYFRTLNEGSVFLRGEGMQKFLSQIRSEAVASLSVNEVDELGALVEPEAESAATSPVLVSRPTVKRWTMSDLDWRLANSDYRPDGQRGAIVFRDAMCDRCHRSGARGPAVGPDLTQIASRFSRKDILHSIIEPSHVVAENYRKVQVATSDGRVIVGRVLIEGDYRSQKLQVATDSLQETQTIEIDKSEIESVQESPVSPMPSGLLDGFQAEEILDLLEYLRLGADRPIDAGLDKANFSPSLK